MGSERTASDGSQVASYEADERFLLVNTGHLRCALPTAMVRQVVRSLSLYPVPGSQPHLLGLAQFAGEPLAVLDLHALVTDGVPGSAHRATVILGRAPESTGRVVGFAVDEAVGVSALQVSKDHREDSSIVTATAMFEGHTVRVVDPSVLFSEDWKPGLGGSDG